MGTPALPTFEQADGLRGKVRLFGQFLLGKVGRVAVDPEYVPKGEPGAHSACLPPLAA